MNRWTHGNKQGTATKCIPCKMMAPILEELAREYKGQLEVVFIDVWKDQVG